MKPIVKTILYIFGIGMLGYGIYTFIQPEASLDVLGMSIEEQDNSQAFITMGIGVLLIIIGAVLPKKN